MIARYTVSAGKEDELSELLPRLAEASRSEPGNVSFAVYHALDDPRDVVLLERYASREAFARHRGTEHFTSLVLDRIVPLLDSRAVETYDVIE
ncbi:MAG: antibiotic biosynthesis monooxygenase [Actinophytocola sp.]|nr:antibiotic biosynthesis monooxygenase [Actinophytocola sp.]